MSRILEEELPRTYLEAVKITKTIGLRYLWIDSLCILQDSTTDWERESARMAEIYSKSYLTISASSSTGSNSGCFASVNTRNVSYTPHELESLGINKPTNSYILDDTRGIITRQYVANVVSKESRSIVDVNITLEWMPCSRKEEPWVYRIGVFGRLVDPVASEHLSSRGWILQERLLSPRVLHCGSAQLYWQCNWSFLGEDGYRFDWSNCNFTSLVEREILPNSECGIPTKSGTSFIEGWPPSNLATHGRWRAGWLHHIQNYSTRSLTFEQDKLPALSGLARMLASQTGDSYYAGLWERHIHEDLCWRVYPRQEIRTFVPGSFDHKYSRTLCVIKRPNEYRAPS
ncbi:uncharacterized protein PAC_16843 [Phialocephala subalpina]|uniref:Heterokaryon incompatibility domain-containing protein n=1 Tax=Phialocephala subalpina TaxID=576137 RepID=A0A1L7XPI5_9HELO|nr:uncharacterized protein PAC_16843 [Phialocephala subalpina]